MGELVNLRRERKQLAARQAAQLAAENRVRHGRTRAEKLADREAEARRAALLDGARLESEGEDGGRR